MTNQSAKNTTLRSRNISSCSTFSDAINTSFFSPDFFALNVTPEVIENTVLDSVLEIANIPAFNSSVEPLGLSIKNTMLAQKESSIEREKATQHKKVVAKKIAVKTSSKKQHAKHHAKQQHADENKKPSIETADTTLDKTLDTLKKEAEGIVIEYDLDSIILNSDIFAKLTMEIENHKEQSAYTDSLLASALESSSLTKTFQNEDGIFIPQSLKSMRRSRSRKKAWKEDLLNITIPSDNFTHTPLREIDFSDVGELAKKCVPETNVKDFQEFDVLPDFPKREEKSLEQTSSLSLEKQKDLNHYLPIIDPLLDNLPFENSSQNVFSMDNMLKVKTVYATSFEETQEDKAEETYIKTSFFELYDQTEISLADTLMWDSAHDSFESRYYILKVKDTKIITENYGTVAEKKEESKITSSLNASSQITSPSSKPLSLDELCFKSPELMDLLHQDSYFNDSISAAENINIFEDFNINTDYIDLTGSLGTNYSFEVLCEKQGLLICLRNEKGKFVQCLPIAMMDRNTYKEFPFLQNAQEVKTFLQNKQEEILAFQNSTHSIVSSSLKRGQEWFNKNVSFEP